MWSEYHVISESVSTTYLTSVLGGNQYLTSRPSSQAQVSK
jgi:hypothetical protein